MQLTFHLFNDTVTTFAAAIKSEKLKGKDGFKPVTLRPSVGFDAEAYLQREKKTTPPWLSYISDHCDIDKPNTVLNKTCSFVLLIKRTLPPANNLRIFAITMGFGHSLLAESTLEVDFGLKVTMNAVAEKKLRSIQARNLGGGAVQRHLVASKDSGRTAFDIDSYMDLVASLEGIIKDADLGRTDKAKKNNKKLLGTRISGSTSCSLTHDASLPELGDKCDKLWATFNSNDYTKLFPEYDNVRVVKNKSKLIDLDRLLGDEIRDRKTENLCLALPDISVRGMIDDFSVHHSGHRPGSMSDLNLSELYSYLDKVGETGEDISAIRLTGLTDGGGHATPSLPLHRCAVWEVHDGGDLYLLTLGRWYKIDKQYAKRKNDEFAMRVKGKVIIDPAYLPKYPKAIALMKPAKTGDRIEREGLYNDHACKQLGAGHCLMDKKFVKIETSIEVCDIFNDKGHFIHVKRGTGNATTSHLFSQGSVSAKMFYESHEYRKQMRSKLPKHLQSLIDPKSAKCDGFTVTFAMIDDAVGFPNNLSFFKKLNLMHHQQIIEMMGYKVAYYHVPHE